MSLRGREAPVAIACDTHEIASLSLHWRYRPISLSDLSKPISLLDRLKPSSLSDLLDPRLAALSLARPSAMPRRLSNSCRCNSFCRAL
jgi:hypothetical protein